MAKLTNFQKKSYGKLMRITLKAMEKVREER